MKKSEERIVVLCAEMDAERDTWAPIWCVCGELVLWLDDESNVVIHVRSTNAKSRRTRDSYYIRSSGTVATRCPCGSITAVDTYHNPVQITHHDTYPFDPKQKLLTPIIYETERSRRWGKTAK